MSESRISKNPHNLFSTRRIENLTDGVFAIAMTLLVLELKVPFGEIIHNQAELVTYLSNNAALFRNFVISFVLLAMMWAVHMRQFEYVRRVDRHVTLVNSLRLLVVVFIPFTTSLAGNFNGFVLAREALAVNFFLLALVSFWQWYYISRHPEFSDQLNDGDRRFGIRRNLVFVVISALVCGLVIPLGEYAYFLYFATPLVMNLVSRTNVKSTA